MRRLTLRARMTLLFTLAFLVAGAVLAGVLYALLSVQLQAEPSVTMAVELPAETPVPPGSATPTVQPLDADVVARIKAAEEAQREETLRGFLLRSLVALLAVGAVAAAVGHLVVRRTLRPIARITETARRVADRHLHERIGLDGPPDEVTELARTFDGMLDRLDRSFAGQRAFVGNASHELRTPLAVQRTLVEVAMDDPEATPRMRALCADLLVTNERSERLIAGLLVLARGEDAPVGDDDVDLAAVVRDELAARDDGLTARGLALRADVRPARVRGSTGLLTQVVANLLDNAVKHNVGEGGDVEVTLHATATDATLRVTNSGPPLTAGDCGRVFEPFVRLGAERVGDSHGLGLSIVRSVVHAHGGSVTAEPGPRGGLAVTVTIPAPGTARQGPVRRRGPSAR